MSLRPRGERRTANPATPVVQWPTRAAAEPSAEAASSARTRLASAVLTAVKSGLTEPGAASPQIALPGAVFRSPPVATAAKSFAPPRRGSPSLPVSAVSPVSPVSAVIPVSAVSATNAKSVTSPPHFANRAAAVPRRETAVRSSPSPMQTAMRTADVVTPPSAKKEASALPTACEPCCGKAEEEKKKEAEEAEAAEAKAAEAKKAAEAEAAEAKKAAEAGIAAEAAAVGTSQLSELTEKVEKADLPVSTGANVDASPPLPAEEGSKGELPPASGTAGNVDASPPLLAEEGSKGELPPASGTAAIADSSLPTLPPSEECKADPLPTTDANVANVANVDASPPLPSEEGAKGEPPPASGTTGVADASTADASDRSLASPSQAAKTDLPLPTNALPKCDLLDAVEKMRCGLATLLKQPPTTNLLAGQPMFLPTETTERSQPEEDAVVTAIRSDLQAAFSEMPAPRAFAIQVN